MGISNRFPGWKEVAHVYAVIVLLIYSWTIIRFLWVFPTWRRHLTAWEITGALANGLVVDLLESALVLGMLVLVRGVPAGAMAPGGLCSTRNRPRHLDPGIHDVPG